MKTYTLKWQYTSGAEYDYQSTDSAQLGQLYRLKALESGIKKIELWQDDFCIISWTRKEGDE